MVDSINLTNYGQVFKDNELSGLKEKNFFYGKNGTGKSTLCQLINEQLGREFDVRVFQGFESVIGEDEKLNSIVLGESNKLVQKEIDSKLEIISENEVQAIKKNELLKSLKGFDEVEKSPFLSQYEKSQDDVRKKENEIGLLYQKCAGEITSEFNLARNYSRKNFRNDIPNSRKLTEDEYKKSLAIYETTEKRKIIEREFPSINFESYCKSVNEIIVSKVNAIVIKELKENSLKRSFAEEGLKIHNEGDKCAFCGGEVTAERIVELESVFNTKEVFRLQDRIKQGIAKIEECIDILSNIDILNASDFYSHLDTEKVNSRLIDIKKEQMNFLKECKMQLEKKEKELFISMDSFEMRIPLSFTTIQKDLNELIKSHNEFSNDIEKSKSEAKRKLILHRVAEKCEQMGTERLQGELVTLKKTSTDLKKILSDEIEKIESDKRKIESEIIEQRKELKQLQEKIKNPEIIIKNINEKISKSGKKNLELKYIESGKHYKIINKDGSTRNIQEISTGEKNIIAFLYFIGSLDSPELETGKPKIIVLDDPMNSNDDTMQYLIISEIEKLYSRKNLFKHFILLTHNSHFYLKVTFGRRVRRDGKNPYEMDNFVRMINDGNLTSFKYLKHKNEDFTTQYGSLWKELKFLYDNDKKDFMCNTIRRIIETYVVFNGVSGNKDAESKMLFNTNSHYTEIGDLETDINGYSREDIIGLMRKFFKQNNAEVHFNNYWNKL
ncbi:AAA family ATPase [Enterococcus faecium]|uniref:AAA family ATPase n=2 Tax=Enterococcus faecium TaxID=1352 RepID=UPI00136A8440|nr:AAA family ATPase [Enterococcus faecium]MCV3195883.1 AAA family ATPase [Enterococcus faecium]MCV6665531.1 AAA family ATPase [Enterococcus faecium]MCW0176031.1 AAA family ATPase [Enterococcus faecium]MDH2765188.1 AAA family ATPase [Enterococcus faecium]MXS23885.1 AAA family ATPase [Enterococcus faecium]